MHQLFMELLDADQLIDMLLETKGEQQDKVRAVIRQRIKDVQIDTQYALFMKERNMMGIACVKGGCMANTMLWKPSIL
jgi:hypothetical protein